MADINCPCGKFLFEDLLRSCGGEYRCIAQGRAPMDADLKTYDFPICDKDNPQDCTHYQRSLGENLSQAVSS
jgi:hypothetical protein